MKNFVRGIVFFALIMPLFSAFLHVIESICDSFNMLIAAKTAVIIADETSKEKQSTRTIGFVSSEEDTYDEG